MKIEVLDVSSKFDLIIEEAKAVALSSADDSRLSAYHSENKELEQLDRIACNTLHDCMQKVFEDGPKRDQRLWMGDLRLQALANYETYQMNGKRMSVSVWSLTDGKRSGWSLCILRSGAGSG